MHNEIHFSRFPFIFLKLIREICRINFAAKRVEEGIITYAARRILSRGRNVVSINSR